MLHPCSLEVVLEAPEWEEVRGEETRGEEEEARHFM
jgi:hypothetical protein